MDIIPILLTSSVTAHDRDVTLKDSDQRLCHTLESIGKWIDIAPDCPIIICDGSGFDFSDIVKDEFPATEIECLKFENDIAKIKEYGRGYGEGEIIKFAIRNSNTIKKHGCFAKISAKLWIDNFSEIRLEWNRKFLAKAVFANHFKPNKSLELAYIDTRFYISSIDFYTRIFWNTHQNIKKNIGIGLEENFLEALQKSNEGNIFFNTYPIVCGTGGGTGKAYKTSYFRKLKEAIKIRIAIHSKKYKSMF